MSQDSGLGSIRRPRETLGGLNVNSGIPQPTSVMKRSSTIGSAPHGRSVSQPRHSLAMSMSRPSQPMFQRSSSGSNLADIGLPSVKRASVAAYSTTQTPAHRPYHTPGPSTDTERRSSVYRPRPSTAGPMGGHQSFFQQAPQAAGVPRDPRPLKDRAYQNRLGQELLEYLAQHNFEMEMSHKLSDNFIKSPTQKDFNYMFQWLYHRIDPSYRFQKNIDQEVPPLLKQLRYPYERSITKSQIAAVGGQNWSTFLGLLHWMMQLAQMLDRYSLNQYDDACLEAGVDVAGDNIIYDFLTSAYQDWLNMDDEAGDDEVDKVLAPHVQGMARAFERANAKYVQELAMLEGENARLRREIEEVEKSTPDPAVLDEQFRLMETDRANFLDYRSKAEPRVEKYDARLRFLQDELEKLEAELKEAEDERNRLKKAVDDQGISMQDIDRMTAERERLQKSIESAGQRLEDVKRRVAEKESEAAQRLDELERLVDQYNSLAFQIGVVPSTAANAKGKDYDLKITVQDAPNFGSSQLQGSYGHGASIGAGGDRLLADPVTGYQPAQVLNLDIRGQVKNSFLALRKEISERRKAALDMMMEDHDLLDRVKEAFEDKKNEVEALTHRVSSLQEEYEKLREVTTAQNLASEAQIEKMEKELASMRAELSESVQLMEQKEMNTRIEYEQLKHRANAVREELHAETSRMITEVVKFKVHIQKSLEHYEGFVVNEMDEELEKELGGDEMRDDTQAMDL